MKCATQKGRSRKPEAFELPDSLDFEIVWEAYGLNQPPCELHHNRGSKARNCRDNPYCLARLGEQKWEKLEEKMKKEVLKVTSSSARRDVRNIPCGLVNNGNFCYVNSFLQIYFNDVKFRRAVFEWRPVEGYEPPCGAKVNIQDLLLCIQKLFATLQITPFEDTAAEELVSLLRLKQTQQDAAEFHSLLFETLLKQLSLRDEWRDLRDVIATRYRGNMTETLSCYCGRRTAKLVPFSYVLLHIGKLHSLSKALEAFLTPERMSEFKCPECRLTETTMHTITLTDVPPVIIFVVQRNAFEGKSRKGKVNSALQYPRVLNVAGNPYECFAVVVHEGIYSDSGHYYDLIKHPVTKKWFSYSDEVVKEEATPAGVDVEKDRISKVTLDMKGCYVLFYRRKDEEVPEIPEVPEHLKAMILPQLEEEFKAETSGTKKSVLLYETTLAARHQRIFELFSRLEVRNGKEAAAHGEDVVFVPLDLLCDVQEKEYEAVASIKLKLTGNSPNGEPSVVKADEEDVAHNAGSDLYKVEPLSFVSFSLCPHQGVSLESVKSGKVKAVAIGAAVELLERYNVKTSVNFDIPTPGRLMNGNDICIECVEEVKEKAKFNRRLDRREKLCKQILKEKKKRRVSSEHAADSFCASVKSLQQYRKLALRAREEFRRSHEHNIAVTFSVDSALKNSDMVMEVDEVKSKCGFPEACSINLLDDDVVVRQVVDNMLSAQEAPPRVAQEAPRLEHASQPDAGTKMGCPSSSGVGHGEKNLGTDEDVSEDEESDEDEETAEVESPSSLEEAPSKRKKVDSGNEHLDGEESSPQDHHDSSPQDNHDSPPQDHHDSSPPDHHDSSPHRDRQDSSNSDSVEDRTAKEGDEEENRLAVFNGDLRCKHGKLDYKVGKSVERCVAVTEEEWATLTERIFDGEHVFVIFSSEPLCSDCEANFKKEEDSRAANMELLVLAKDHLGDLMKNLARRKCPLPPGLSSEVVYSRAICADFVKAMNSRFRHGCRNSKVPRLCQECIICREHNLPCVPLSSENKVCLLTVDEWTKILDALAMEESQTVRVVVENGKFANFCDVCYEKQRVEEENKRFIYERGATIYVKLKKDEGEEPQKENGSSTRSGTATRSAIAKNCMKFNLTSDDTILTLKQKIYEKTGQSPVDQLLYMRDQLLLDSQTLGEAHVDPEELKETPLTLIVQSAMDEIPTSPDLPNGGFADTALS